MILRPALVAPLLAALLLAGPGVPAGAGEVPPGWKAALATGHSVRITAEPARLAGGTLNGMSLRGTWVLAGDWPTFGAFSGLLIREGRLYAVSDHGWWLGAEMAADGGGIALRNARMARLRDADGKAYDKTGGDAEGLALDGGRLMVSFERDHRIMRLGLDGRMERAFAPPAFARLRNNKGVEALAGLPETSPGGGGLIALAEGRTQAGAPVFVIRRDGSVIEDRLPVRWLHAVTGADIGPDGRLYLVLREFSALFGVSIRVMRYRLGDNGLPLPESAEVLAAFEAASGIDNMEGISLDRGPDGKVRLWLISDDNFRSTQRTLLVAFDVLP